MLPKIKVGIVGGAGYTAGELIRILLHHPNVQLQCIHSKSNAGKAIAQVHQDLIGDTDLVFDATIKTDVDVIFLCLGHGESTQFLQDNDIPAPIKIIDLANDFRLPQHNQFNNRHFVYGLPALHYNEIVTAQNIANPGCFATAIQLGLLPLAKVNALPSAIYVTGITGATGAGQGLAETSHFSWRANNIQAYKTLTHQHLAEINASVQGLQTASVVPQINFVPWRGDFTRGIFVSTQLPCSMAITELYHMYEQFYVQDPFVKMSKNAISLKQVVNTNKCLIQIEQIGNQIVIHTAIDNLLKGASGQAVQNMNLMFGLAATTGLQLKANYF